MQLVTLFRSLSLAIGPPPSAGYDPLQLLLNFLDVAVVRHSVTVRTERHRVVGNVFAAVSQLRYVVYLKEGSPIWALEWRRFPTEFTMPFRLLQSPGLHTGVPA